MPQDTSTSLLSQRIEKIAVSATMAMTQAARDLKAQGRDVISLSAGEPDFDTPDHICRAANEAIAAGHTRYTAVDGIMPLKEAICEKFKRDNELDYTPSQIHVAPGGKPVLFNALAATINKGDEVIIPAPCWVSYPDMVRLCGGVPIIVPCDASKNYMLSPRILQAAISPRTKWIILNSPSNPTGAAYSAAKLKALASVLRANPHVMVLSDDIYEHLVYDDFTFTTMAQIAPDLKDRVLTMNGVSKAYAMTGWRIGYGAGPEWLISAMRKYAGQTTSNPSSISQHAALAALGGPHDFLDDWKAAYRRRRDMMAARINAIDGLSCQTPVGAFYLFVDCRQRHDDDRALAMSLLNDQAVATVPGTAFHAPGHLRLSYAASDDELDKACTRLEKYFN